MVSLLVGTPNSHLSAQSIAPEGEILAQFEAYAEKAREEWSVPGMAVAVVHDDKVIYAKGFGVKRAGGSEPIDPDTVFEIGSTSKAFTAALVAMQVDAGKAKWTDRVMDHLPNFVMYDPWVTREFQVRDMMAQHSGMPPSAGDGLAIFGFSADDIVSKIRLLKPVSSFRSEFAYVNNLFLVAADLVNQTSGVSWAENLQKKIFEPLGMKSSSSSQAAFQVAPNAASPHKLVNGAITAFAGNASELAWAYTYAPAGGINSTVLDMAQWLRLLLGRGSFEGRQIISAENLGLTMSPQTIIQIASTGPLAKTPFGSYRNFYCESWMYTAAQPQPLIWHNGDNQFMHAAIGVMPQANTGIVILTNMGGSSMAEAVMWKYYDLVFNNPRTDWSTRFLESWREVQKTAQAPYSQRPEQPAPGQPLTRYTGTFTNHVYGKLSVKSDGQTLWLIIGPGQVRMNLIHWDHDTFIAAQPKMDAFLGETGFARFMFGSDGKVASITLDELADVDNGMFIAN